MKSLLLHLGLEDLFAIKLKFAIRVAESVSVGGWKICGIKDIHTEFAHVVNTLTGIQLHLDREIFQADFDAGDLSVFVFKLESGRVIL
jgi:hypothetical protein